MIKPPFKAFQRTLYTIIELFSWKLTLRMVDSHLHTKRLPRAIALPGNSYSDSSLFQLQDNILALPHTHLKTLGYSLRRIFFYTLIMVMTPLLNGCSSHQKRTSQHDVFEYERTGIASYYAKKHQGRKTASGDIFNNNSLTGAHRTLPFGTTVLVKNVHNGKAVKITINDRGPFLKGRIIDLSKAAFSKIANLNKGLTQVEIMVVK